MTPAEIATQIQNLLPNIPKLAIPPLTNEKHQWMGDAHALVKSAGVYSGDLDDEKKLKTIIDNFVTNAGAGMLGEGELEMYINQIQSILNRSLSNMKLKASDPDDLDANDVPFAGIMG